MNRSIVNYGRRRRELRSEDCILGSIGLGLPCRLLLIKKNVERPAALLLLIIVRRERSHFRLTVSFSDRSASFSVAFSFQDGIMEHNSIKTSIRWIGLAQPLALPQDIY